MAMILKREQVGTGLEVNSDHHLAVKAGRNVIVDAGGVHVDFPPVQQAPKAIADLSINGTQVTKTYTDGNTANETLPTLTVDVHLAGLTFEEGKLKATLSDGTTAETHFSADFLISIFESMNNPQKGQIVNALLNAILNGIRGEEVNDFANKQLGYLLKVNPQ